MKLEHNYCPRCAADWEAQPTDTRFYDTYLCSARCGCQYIIREPNDFSVVFEGFTAGQEIRVRLGHTAVTWIAETCRIDSLTPNPDGNSFRLTEGCRPIMIPTLPYNFTQDRLETLVVFS